MAITDESGGFNVSMPVAPAYGGYGNQGGFGGFGGDWGWIILLLLCGWGGMGMGGFGGFGGGFGNMFEFPWLLNGQNGINNNVNDGFRSAQISDNITSVRDGVSNLATQLCGCCGDIQMGIAGINQNIGNSTAAIQNSLCQGFAVRRLLVRRMLLLSRCIIMRFRALTVLLRNRRQICRALMALIPEFPICATR